MLPPHEAVGQSVPLAEVQFPVDQPTLVGGAPGPVAVEAVFERLRSSDHSLALRAMSLMSVLIRLRILRFLDCRQKWSVAGARGLRLFLIS